MKKISFTILLTFTAAAAFAQNASQVQKLFEAGQYQRVVESAQPDGDPAVLYTAAQSHQKLGLVYAKRQEWAQAAGEFDRVLQASPANAYAHYYGGLMEYRANHPDRMATHFEQFLKLAPDAPERPEVTQIMRTVRGR
jgi:tetratricopeptide (TPR) repeat protein